MASDVVERREAAGAAAAPDAELVGVTKVYDDGTLAVDDVTLHVARGEFFAILGPSGCGKSTTLRMIAGLERPTRGEIYIRGELMNRRPAHRRPTNMVFQQLALFPHLDVAQNIAYGLRLKRLPGHEVRRRVDEALDLVQLTGLGTRRIHQLSGGQQQRVAIARALVVEPAVLLLDEPLGSLDLKLRLQLQEALGAIQRRTSTTFVYVTHDQGEALRMSDRIAIMNRGRVVQVGRPAELYEAPRTRFAATFLGDTNLFDGRVVAQGMFESEGLRLRVPPGSGVAVSVRPEQVRIVDGDGLPNTFGGHVDEVVYLGSHTRYVVALDAGRKVTTLEPNGRPSRHLAKGDRVTVGWEIDAQVLLQE
jgi:spermidine/putrescine transport system ATP-binding protein